MDKLLPGVRKGRNRKRDWRREFETLMTEFMAQYPEEWNDGWTRWHGLKKHNVPKGQRYLYVIHAHGEAWQKIGITNNPVRRLLELQDSVPNSELYFVFLFLLEDKAAQEMEAHVLKQVGKFGWEQSGDWYITPQHQFYSVALYIVYWLADKTRALSDHVEI